MPAKSKEPKSVKFVNLKVSDVVMLDLLADIPPNSLEMVADFLDASTEGAKVSFGAKPDSFGYSVAVTLPVVGHDNAGECASFWAGDPYEAFAKAYIMCFTFDAVHKGWAHAEREHKVYEKEIIERLKTSRPQRTK